DPVFRAAVRELVVNQLWYRTPSEVTDAALRLQDAGMDRMQVLAELGLVLSRFVNPARLEVPTEPARINRAVDLAGYRATLASLGAKRKGGHLRGL
ncbi:MAG TPA: hypothetical protein VIG41_04615, partial [Micrococcaceae bacterium]